MKRMKLLFTLAIPVILCQNAQAQTSSRLTAMSHWHNNGVVFRPADSTAYNYLSNERGGDLNHTLKYDNATMWNFLGDTAYQNAQYTVQEFDANNNIIQSTIQVWDTATHSWTPSYRWISTYNSSNQPTSVIQQSWTGTGWLNWTKNVYTYSAGRLTIDLLQTWDAPTLSFISYSEKIYYYDPINGDLLSQTNDIVTTGGGHFYTSQDIYVYDSGTNNLRTVTHQLNSSGAFTGFINDSLTTNNYDTLGNRISTEYQTWDTATAAWMPKALHLYSNFTTGHMPQTDILQMWNPFTGTGGAWENSMMFTYTYNSFGQLTSSIGESWQPGVGWEFALGDPMARYHYGTYSGVYVKNIVSANGGAEVYPVPAQNTLHIDLKWNEAQAATIAIYDMNGRVVTQWSTPVASDYRTGVSVCNFAPGLYVIKINGTQGQIVKQMVVTH